MPPDFVDLSLNEVETLAQKAARGAGLPWGVAEDTGRTAAWIARRIGPWANTLLALLEAPPPDAKSPLLLAGWLADAGEDRRIANVAFPLWALPGLLATTARPVSIALGNVELRCNPGTDPGATHPAEALAAVASAGVTVTFAHSPLAPLPYLLSKRFQRCVVPCAAWRRLEALAYRTYVPASEHSRRTGAGAGRLDDE